jgi:hypothetical protein
MYNQLRDVYVVICVILLADGSEYTEQACGGDEYPLWCMTLWLSWTQIINPHVDMVPLFEFLLKL